jgi:hypothetical protein
MTIQRARRHRIIPRTSAIANRASFMSSQTSKHRLNSSKTLRNLFIHDTVLLSFGFDTNDSYLPLIKDQLMGEERKHLDIELKQSPEYSEIGFIWNNRSSKYSKKSIHSSGKRKKMIQEPSGAWGSFCIHALVLNISVQGLPVSW